MFGKDRLREVIKQNANQPAELITRAIHDAVRTFRGTVDQQDDITLVVIKMLE
jgi:sigma-B regulation protein RsbU (phosphoserine phosphatase)